MFMVTVEAFGFWQQCAAIVVCLNIQDCEIFTGGSVNCVLDEAAE